MSLQARIDNLISQNSWEPLFGILKENHGCIGKFGGRYGKMSQAETIEFFDINKTCWTMYKAIVSDKFKAMPKQAQMPVVNVIDSLRRVYDESQTELNSNTTSIAWFATRVFDHWETIADGYQPIDRLELVKPSEDSNQRVEDSRV